PSDRSERSVTHVATRQQRMDAFVHEGEPPADGLLDLLCEDHVGTYVLPFACRWESGDWTNAETGARIEASVVGWARTRKTERNHRGGQGVTPFRNIHSDLMSEINFIRPYKYFHVRRPKRPIGVGAIRRRRRYDDRPRGRRHSRRCAGFRAELLRH